MHIICSYHYHALFVFMLTHQVFIFYSSYYFSIIIRYVILDNQMKGYAFMVPNGCRIFCTLQSSGGDIDTLCIRSDSSALLETLVGTESIQTTFLKFVLGSDISVVSTSTNGGQSKSPGKLQTDIGHDFPSLTMPGRTPVAVWSA